MKPINFFKHFVLPFLLAVASGLVMATPPDIATILGATKSTDKASAVFTFVLGNFFTNPLSLIAGSPTLIGKLFLIFNGFVFLVGTLWASYGLISGIVETAHSGEVLGKRLSAVWLPIRMVTGIAGIAPIFSGFSLAQVFIVTMSGLGIGIANLMWTGAVTASAEFNTLIPASAALSAASPTGVNAAAEGMFQIHVCNEAQKKLNTDIASLEPIFETTAFGQTFGSVEYAAYSAFGTKSNPAACGASSIQAVKPRDRDSATGFRSSAVDYGAFSAMQGNLKTVAVEAFKTMNTKTADIAKTWFAAYTLSKTGSGAPVPGYPQAQLDAVAASYSSALMTIMESLATQMKSTNPALSAEIQKKMLEDGWFGAGAWFATFAESNAAMADVMASLTVSASPPTAEAKTSSVGEALAAISKSQDVSGASNSAQASEGTSGTFSAITSYLCKELGWADGATRSCSFGQAIVRKGIKSAAIGSGGGGFGDVGLINPIIMFKNMGDYSMTAAQSLYGVMKFALPDSATSGSGSKADGPGLIGKAVSFVAGKLIPSFVVSAIKDFIGVLPIIAGTMLILGLVMSIYIPLIPFITWMGGLVQYCVVVLQGLVGAPIAALSHLDAEGEGMGRRTEAGYMFALNVTFRPALMLLGFFFASAIMIALGSFQANLFLAAMSNAQGNSMTGLFSIIGFLVVFFVLNVTLIQGLFNMIFLLPDQILSLIGSGGHMADLGKEVESKVHGLFMAGARMSGGPGMAKMAAGAGAGVAGTANKLRAADPETGGRKG